MFSLFKKRIEDFWAFKRYISLPSPEYFPCWVIYHIKTSGWPGIWEFTPHITLYEGIDACACQSDH